METEAQSLWMFCSLSFCCLFSASNFNTLNDFQTPSLSFSSCYANTIDSCMCRPIFPVWLALTFLTHVPPEKDKHQKWKWRTQNISLIYSSTASEGVWQHGETVDSTLLMAFSLLSGFVWILKQHNWKVSVMLLQVEFKTHKNKQRN